MHHDTDSRLEGNLEVLVLSFCHWVPFSKSGCQAQQQALCQLSYLTGPKLLNKKEDVVWKALHNTVFSFCIPLDSHKVPRWCGSGLLKPQGHLSDSFSSVILLGIFHIQTITLLNIRSYEQVFYGIYFKKLYDISCFVKK